MKPEAQKITLFIASALLTFGLAYSAQAITSGADLFGDFLPNSDGLPDIVNLADYNLSDFGDFEDVGTTNGQTPSLGGNPSAAQERITNLSQSTRQTAREEAQELSKLQQADFEACQAEAGRGGGMGSGLPGGGSLPGGSGMGSPVGSGGTMGNNEQATREALKSQGIEVKKQPCNGRDYRTVAGGCTDVAGMPQLAVDRLGEMDREMGGGIVLTGGTETGHKTHAPGQSIVDIAMTSQSREYVNKHAVESYPSKYGNGTWYLLDNGDKFLDESDHWHIVFNDKNVPSGSSNNSAILASNQSGFQLVKNKIQSLFAWLGKKIKGISFANIVNADSSVNLGGNLIDPTNISPERLEEIISEMSQAQINRDFSQMNASALSDLLEQMGFNSINTVFDNLSGENINNIVSTLGGETFNDFAHLLVDSSASNIFSNMSVTGFDSLLTGIEDGPLNMLISSLDQTGINNMLTRANDDILNQVFGNLGIGGINNIIAGGSEDLLRGVMNSLGQGNIEQIFESVGISTAGKLLESVGSDFLNEVIPDMSSLGLDNVFGNLGDGNFDQLLGNITGENWEQVFSQLGGVAADDLIGSLGADMMNEILPTLSDGALNNLFGNIGGDALGMLAEGLSADNLNNIIEDLGAGAINNTLGSLGDKFGDILPNLTDNALGNLLLGGDNSILQAALSGAPEGIVGAALEKLPSGILDQAADIPIVGNLIGGSGGGILGGAASLVTGAGLYVPVVEQQGQLMTATQNTDKQTASIDKTTQEIRDLSIQICTHLRAIRRIQTSFESMKIADEVNANRTRLEALAKYASDVAGKDNPDSLIKTGYKTIIDGNYVNIQAFPKNLDEHLTQIKEEAKQVVLADIRNSNNLYKEELVKLVDDESASQIDSTVTKEEIEEFRKTDERSAIKTAYAPSFSSRLLAYLPSFISRPLSKLAFGKTASAGGQATATNSSSATDFWNMWFKVTDPENNPYGSAMLAMEAKERAQNIAEAQARDEYLAGQGILPSGRKCVEEVKDENNKLVACRKWETVAGEGAPGIIVKDTLSSALLLKYNSYLNPGGPESQPPGSAPDAHEPATGGYEPPTSAGKGPGQNNKPGQGTDGQHIPTIDPAKTEQAVKETQESSLGTPTTGGFGGSSGSSGSSPSGSGDIPSPSDSGPNLPDNNGSVLNWSDLLGQLSNLWNRSGDSEDNDSQYIISMLLSLAQNAFRSQPPLIQADAISPTLAEINSGRKPNQVKLTWATPNSTCQTANDWLSRTEDGNFVIVKKTGDDLGHLGSLIVKLPLAASSSLSITNGDVVNNVAPQKNTSTDKTVETLSFSLSSVTQNSQISFYLEDKTVKIQANEAKEVLTKLRSEIERLSLNDYNLEHNLDTQTLTVSLKAPTYKLSCKNSNGENIKTINIER